MIDERTLPIYLQKDIEWLNSLKKTDLAYGDVWCELYGSINGAQWDNEISESVADYLREKYLGLTYGDGA